MSETADRRVPESTRHDETAAGSSAAPDPPTEVAARSVWDRATASFRRWRGGDLRAMDDLVRDMTPVLWHVVRSYRLERAVAEDVVQTTWLTLVRRHDTIADERAVAGWLTTCARREAWRVSRSAQKARPTEAEELDRRIAPTTSAEDEAQLADSDRLLWRAVQTLDERCRQLLRIVAFEDRPDYAKIAQDLSMPIGSIGPTRKRCLLKLRVALSAADETEGTT